MSSHYNDQILKGKFAMSLYYNNQILKGKCVVFIL